jgi:hypothetical protein
MANDTDITNLRNLMAEAIPAGGAETDTYFTNVRIGEIFDGANGQIEAAAHDGWREKAGLLAGLVNVTDGAASRELSDLLDNALAMTKIYSKSSFGPTEGRTRIGKISRPT